MDAIILALALAALAWMFLPAARGVASAIDSVEQPHKPDTAAERQQGNSDMLRILFGLAIVFGLMFVVKMGG